MIATFHKKFHKKFNKLPEKIRQHFQIRLKLFLHDPYDPLLNNHSVDKAYPGWRSINVTSDYRALFELKEDAAVFMTIDTHSNLYR